MSDTEQLEDLLVEWEDRRAGGQQPRLEELCADFPHLLEPLKVLLAELAPLEELIHDTVSSTSSMGAAHAGSVHPLSEVRISYHSASLHTRGGVGELFKARDDALGRDVAVKVIQPQFAGNPDHERRFLWEAEVTSRLDHPGIVPVYTVGRSSDGRPSYSMRFIRGETLMAAITRFHAEEKPGRDATERSLAFRQLLTRFVAVCNTIAYAHSRGIIHRDIKPANIMLGPYGETLVLDWGLAKHVGRQESAAANVEETLTPVAAADTPMTQPGSPVGTLGYMSPEQAAGNWDAMGPASDIYSLGATLYAILTGQAPHQGKSKGDILQKVQRGEFPRPRELKRDTPEALEAICLKTMSLRPDDRYQVANELAADVERWAGDERVQAWNEPWAAKIARYHRRHPKAVWIGSAFMVVLMLSLGVVTYLWGVTNWHRVRSEETLEVFLNLQGKAHDALTDVIRGRTAYPRSIPQPLVYSPPMNIWFEDSVKSYEKLSELYPKYAGLRHKLTLLQLRYYESVRGWDAEFYLKQRRVFLADIRDAKLKAQLEPIIGDELAFWRKARALRPYDGLARRFLAIALSNHGIKGTPQENVALLKEANLLFEPPQDTFDSLAALQNHAFLADQLMRLHRYDEAAKVLQEGKRIGQKALDDSPGHLGLTLYIAGLYFTEGLLRGDQNQIPQAIEAYRHAASLAKQVAREDQQDVVLFRSASRKAALSLYNLSLEVGYAYRPEALEVCREALEASQAYLELDPNDGEVYYFRAVTQYNTAIFTLKKNPTTDVVALLKRACTDMKKAVTSDALGENVAVAWWTEYGLMLRRLAREMQKRPEYRAEASAVLAESAKANQHVESLKAGKP